MNKRLVKNDESGIYEVNIVISGPLRIGSRIRQMLICQPSISSIDYWPSCLCRRNTMSNPAGLTVGDVYGKIESISEQH